MALESRTGAPLVWHQTAGWWHADGTAAQSDPGSRWPPRQSRAATYRIYPDDSCDPEWRLWVWEGQNRPESPDDEYVLDSESATLTLPCGSTEEARSIAGNMEARRHRGPHEFLHGFRVQLRSTVDGDRHIIIDERDDDMEGWKLEIRSANGDLRIEGFDRGQSWACYSNGAFDCFGYGGAEWRHPWSVGLDHNESIVRWIEPD